MAADGFDLVALGGLGGIEDGNLSAWLIHPHGDARAVTCDAGTLVNGLRVADEKGPSRRHGAGRFGAWPRGLRPHRDDQGISDQPRPSRPVAGLVIASPDDGKKPIYALPSVSADLVESYFNWKAWPNFTDRGKAPQLKKYALEDLKPGVATPLKDTAMSVTRSR